ncbi:MAG: hypothetical protein ACJ8GV_01430 [Luteimonas sp.]
MPQLLTPDGRYLIVRGRLWRTSNPGLPDAERQRLVDALMDARRAVKHAKHADDADALAQARGAVDAAKHALGERGPVWWTDGTPDYNRYLVKNSPYADWYAER